MSLFTDVEMQSISAFVRSKKITSSSINNLDKSKCVTKQCHNFRKETSDICRSFDVQCVTTSAHSRTPSTSLFPIFTISNSEKSISTFSKVKAPLKERGSCVSLGDKVSLSEERYIGG